MLETRTVTETSGEMPNIGTKKPTPTLMRVLQYFAIYTLALIGVLVFAHQYTSWAITSITSWFGYDSATVFRGDASAFAALKDPSLEMVQYFKVFHVVVYLIIVINIVYVAVQLLMLQQSHDYYQNIANLFSSKPIQAYGALVIGIFGLVELLPDPAEALHGTGMKLLFHYHPYIYLFAVLTAIDTVLMLLSPMVIAAVLAFMRNIRAQPIH